VASSPPPWPWWPAWSGWPALHECLAQLFGVGAMPVRTIPGCLPLLVNAILV
jgi:hypothetical protein